MRKGRGKERQEEFNFHAQINLGSLKYNLNGINFDIMV